MTADRKPSDCTWVTERDVARLTAGAMEVSRRHGWRPGGLVPSGSNYTHNDARAWAVRFLTEESERTFYLGTPHFSDLLPFALIVEAARALCGMNRRTAARMLRHAANVVEQNARDRGTFEEWP